MSDFEKYSGNRKKELTLKHIEELFASGDIKQGLQQAKILLENFHPKPPRLPLVEEIRLAETEVSKTSDYPPPLWHNAAVDIEEQIKKLRALIVAHEHSES